MFKTTEKVVSNTPRWFHCRILSNIWRINTNYTQITSGKEKFPPENRGRGDTLHSFYETSISLIPKLDKNSTKKKTKDKYPSWTQTQKYSKNIGKLNPAICKNSYTPQPSGFILDIEG